ncbi:MAG: HD domain-containing protein, partial [Ignisphaera sp.]
FLSSYICLDIGSRINVNLGKLILYTIVHDIGEAFTGDIVKVFSSEVGDRKKVIELRLVEEGIDSDTIKKLYISYTNQDDVESKVAKLCNYIATYVKGLEYKSLGFDVADIIDGVEKEIEKASKELGIDDTIKNIVQKYIKK